MGSAKRISAAHFLVCIGATDSSPPPLARAVGAHVLAGVVRRQLLAVRRHELAHGAYEPFHIVLAVPNAEGRLRPACGNSAVNFTVAW